MRKGAKTGSKIKNLFIIPIIILVVSSFAIAHEAEEPLSDYFVELTPESALQNNGIALEAHITDKQGNPLTGLTVTFTVDRHEIGLSDVLATKEREPGHYYTKYTFRNAGLHEVHVEFSVNGENIRRTANINIISTSPNLIAYLPIIAIIAVVIIFAIKFLLHGKKKGRVKMAKKRVSKEQKSSSLKYVAIVFVVLFIAVLGYSLYVYYQSGAAEQGIIVCSKEDPNQCVWQAHIHSYVIPTICGEEQRLPTEVGSLQKAHTHEEKNTIHFHASLPYDKARGEIIDKTQLKIGTFFDEIGVQLSNECFMGKCNGDLCGNKAGTLKIFANTEKYWEKSAAWQETDRNYVWSDRDIIYIAFDERSEEETLSYLNSARIEWPVLGVG